MAKKRFLGDVRILKKNFSGLDAVFKKFEKKEFKKWVDRKRSDFVNRTLLELIQKEPEPCFLLGQVLSFIERVSQENILHHYTFTSFELWLNQYSSLSFEENLLVRAKIVGKRLQRSDYQILFPIGMGKVYEGTHFVTAHKSPDLDTTIASFWGWVDAFAARVGDGLHIWNLPDGPPASQIEIDWVFKEPLGPAVFSHLPKTRTSLHLTGNDLMTQRGFQKKTLSDSISWIDHDRDQSAVVVVDKEGFYLGDWRHFDVEGIRQVTSLLNSCLSWFEKQFNLHLTSFFAKEKIRFDELAPSLHLFLKMAVAECTLFEEFSLKQKNQIREFLKSVLGIKEGVDISFISLVESLCRLSEIPFYGMDGLLGALKTLFDEKGVFIAERSALFSFIQKSTESLYEGMAKIRARLELLDVALATKSSVFGHLPTYVTVRSDVEEIRGKMATYPYLTVVYPDHDKLYPVGIIQAADLRKNSLGTVSLRDFCNKEEMGIPSYLEVISVIDHHKSSLFTTTPPMATVADVQSSNTLVAQKIFQINDAYTLSGCAPEKIKSQMKKKTLSLRLKQRLLQKLLVVEKKSPCFIHPDREYLEYLHFLYGILDDTDLLSKVSALDVECVASLLNRMKSIMNQEETELVDLSDLPRDSQFPKKAAKRILQNEDMYSLYRKTYEYREQEVARNIVLSAKGAISNIFADTKEQNGCCRVGQTKLFQVNIPLFNKHANEIRHQWLEAAKKVFKQKPEIDLHIHMMSTIVSAEEVYKGKEGNYAHKDELWIWIPEGAELAIEHLKRFLSAFKTSAGLKNNPLEVEFLGANRDELAAIFKESFLPAPQTKLRENLPIAVLRYNAGSLNSRKSMVTPYLPT